MINIEITFPSGKRKLYPSGIKTGEVVTDIEFRQTEGIVAGRLNNEIVSLSYGISVNSTIEPVTLNSKEGTTLYRKTLCFLLAKASYELFPGRRLVISHSLGEGYYYYFEGLKKIDENEIGLLTEKIKTYVEQDLPIQHNVISYLDALEYFKKNNLPHTQLLLKYQNRSKIPIYECGDFIDLAYGPLLARSGLLKSFEIMNYPPGFLLRYPKFGGTENVPVFKENPVLFSIYKEYKNWGKILNMNCIGQLNQLIDETQHKEFILISEALQDKKIASIADTICHKKDQIMLILVAGPSSSGKTTFAKKLAIQLKVLGRNPVTLSIDNYFFSKDKTPLDEYGKPNYETLDAIDLALLNDQLVRLFAGETVFIPVYNFANSEREPQGKPLKLPPRPCLILEGIHGLNDKLISKIERDRKFKIYISALTQLNLDDHNRISTTDNRLLRRMVRDYKFRGHSALKTLKMWPAVRKGEDTFIFPFQNTADAAFNSALDYELAVLKLYAEPLLRTITPEYREYSEAARLLSFLTNILPIPPTWVPQQSILREFIGESIFE